MKGKSISKQCFCPFIIFILYKIYALYIIHYTLSLISASNQISSRINSQEDKEKDGETPQ